MIKCFMVGLISAVPFEAEFLLEAIRGKRGKDRQFMTGVAAGKEAVFTCSGVGIANASRATALLAERFRPRLIVVFGIAGAYPASGLKRGDVAAAESEVYADCGAVRGGKFIGFREMGFPLLRRGKMEYFNEFPMDKTLLKKAGRLFPGLRTGIFLTVCAASRDRKRALALERLYGGITENMEGAAAAHAAVASGIPALEIRGISNMAGEPPALWDKETAALNCQKAVIELLKVL